MKPTPIIEAGQLSLSLPSDLSFGEWSDLGRKLCMGARTIKWLIGDWLIAGVERFDDKAREEANRIFRADVARFDPILKTCRRFPEPKRHASLTFGHHLAVMPIEDDREAEELLSEAERHRMTVAALKAQVRVTSLRQTHILDDDDPEDTAMRRIIHAWNLAPRTSRQSFFELASESDMGVIEL